MPGVSMSDASKLAMVLGKTNWIDTQVFQEAPKRDTDRSGLL